jgi:hypothetical protein
MRTGWTSIHTKAYTITNKKIPSGVSYTVLSLKQVTSDG